MHGRKRGNYFQYLNNNENAAPPKIPRQTLFNRKHKVIFCTHYTHSRSVHVHFFILIFFNLKAPNKCSIFELVSSLTNANNAVNSIDNITTENDLNNINNNCNDNNDTDAMENEEIGSFNASGPTIEMSNEDINFIENEYEFEELTEQTEYFAQHMVDAEDMCNLHPNTNCTVLDVYCMIYAFFIRHNITWTAVEDLLLLCNNIIGNNILQSSVHTFKKKIRKILNCDVIKHFICHNCELYLGTIEMLNKQNIKFCPSCRTEIQTNTKYKKNHFVTIPIENHLHDVLTRNRDNLKLNFDTLPTEISDVHDSFYFQQLREKIGNIPAITLTFSTDGAAKFKSCKEKSVWPIQFVINEISLEHRYKRENTFCAAVSFGRTPNMQSFFKPFIQEIKKINESGGLTIKLQNGDIQKIKIFPMIFTADTPARADVLMKSYFNGYNGCSYCHHAGTLVNRQIRYCKRDNANLRTNQQVRENMVEAQVSNSKVNGYKGMSPLMAFEYFDLVWQAAIDKMHNIDLGVISLLFNLFLESKNRKEWFVLCFFIRKNTCKCLFHRKFLF